LYEQVDIKIVEPTNELLGAFAQDLKKYTMKKFRADGIDLLTGTGVKKITHMGEENDP
jgi:NADH dehydrogenase FAD-containing subunit